MPAKSTLRQRHAFRLVYESIADPRVRSAVQAAAGPITSSLGQTLLKSARGTLCVEDLWVEMPLPNGWVAAFRLGVRGPATMPQTSILELRVFPDEPKREPGEWSAKYLGQRAEPPPKPFSFRALSGLRWREFESVVQKHLNQIRQQQAEEAFSNVNLPGKPRRGRSRGRTPRVWQFYRDFAQRYREVEHTTRKVEGFRSTRRRLAEEYKAPETTIASWIRAARRHGFLGETKPGKRGEA